MKTLNVNPILAVGICIMCILLWLSKCHKENVVQKDNTNLVTALQDSIRYFKKKDSSNVAQIAVLTTQTDDAFTSLMISDSTVRDLQKTVKDYEGKLREGSSVTNALLTTIAQLKGNPTIKYLPGDTVRKDNILYIYPTYIDSLQDKWVTLRAWMNKDSSKFDLKVDNKFSAVVGYDKKKKAPFVDLITDNPYTKVTTLRSYQVEVPKPKKFGIGLSAGVTLGQNLRATPYVGVGFNYTIIRLW